MKLYLLIILTLFLSFTAFGQKPERGNPAELKGLKKMHIRTEDTESRDIITREIKKAKLAALEMVEDEKSAQIILIYERGKTPGAAKQRYADAGLVMIESKTPDLGRILLNYENTKNSRSADKSAREFAKAFIKAYKSANEIR